MYTAPPSAPFDSGLFLQSIGFSLIGVVAGAILNSGFIILTGINIGFLALAVGWLVAKTMMIGSKGNGGRPYQIAAVILTLISVALSNSVIMYWLLQKAEPISPTFGSIVSLIILGFERPFLRLVSSPVNALIGIFIIFVGARAAWRMTSGDPATVRHPFAR
ncbi:MAG TPA: hypothetical protein VGN16_08165 [Acidobacteriaceae bacterium]